MTGGEGVWRKRREVIGLGKRRTRSQESIQPAMPTVICSQALQLAICPEFLWDLTRSWPALVGERSCWGSGVLNLWDRIDFLQTSCTSAGFLGKGLRVCVNCVKETHPSQSKLKSSEKKRHFLWYLSFLSFISFCQLLTSLIFTYEKFQVLCDHCFSIFKYPSA